MRLLLGNCYNQKIVFVIGSGLMTNIHNFVDIQNVLNASVLGKRLPNTLYIYYSVISYLADVLQQYENCARQIFDQYSQSELSQKSHFTLIKFNLSGSLGMVVLRVQSEPSSRRDIC